MQLESDTIFGNGMSMPGGEDIGIQTDLQGFPFLKGSTLKGIFREELINLLSWMKMPEEEAIDMVRNLMGESGADDTSSRKLVFSDLTMHPDVIERIEREEGITSQEIIEMLTYLRTFTELEDGIAKGESLRTARCIKKGLNFYGTCTCAKDDVEIVQEVLRLIKWAGSMRSRGFGKVRVRGEEIRS
jgi:Uncharacterized protein predicted to be involved in DNA repair (RAMP superfamily)